MKRWKCLCAYDGTDFAGWQSQPTGDAVQDHLEAALAAVFKSPVRIHGSGRTDAGVHALGQVFHFDASWNHGRGKLLSALGSHLPSSIQLKSACPVSAAFHARYSARAKRYHYRLYLGRADPFETDYVLSIPFPLDVDAMERAGQCLIGKFDFSAFGAVGRGSCPRENPIKEFMAYRIRKRGKRIRMTFEASGFLYKMARSLSGALLRVGQGKLSPEDFEQILLSGMRTADVVTAPPRGLFLEKVYYQPEILPLTHISQKMRRER